MTKLAALQTLPTPTQIRVVPLGDVTIDTRVQRAEGVDERRVAKMAAAFNPNALGVLILSHREDGTYVVLDGMHRRAAAIEADWTGDVYARVFTNLTLAEEGALFLLYNDKKNPTALTKFLVRVTVGEPVATAIRDIAADAGWIVRSGGKTPHSIFAVQALERAYTTATGTLPKGEYPEVLARTLTIITNAWGHDPAAVQDSLIGGVSQLLGHFGDLIDDDKVTREMQKTTPRALIGRARTMCDLQGGTVPAALGKILATMHDTQRRTHRLPEWVWVR